jgi:hypothetical protein
MRSISAGSVVERNNSRWRSTRLSMSTHDWHMTCMMPIFQPGRQMFKGE